MTREEIRERNIQIAQMLGWKYLTWQEISLMSDKSIKSGWWSTFPVHYHAKIHRNVYKGRSHNDLKFNSDWNWLMQAVEFIEKEWRFDIEHHPSVSLSKNHVVTIWRKFPGGGEEFAIEVESSDKKEAVFIAVSDFAKKQEDTENLNPTTQVVRDAMKAVSKHVRLPKAVRDGIVKKK
jgi:hypothetical protein